MGIQVGDYFTVVGTYDGVENMAWYLATHRGEIHITSNRPAMQLLPEPAQASTATSSGGSVATLTQKVQVQGQRKPGFANVPRKRNNKVPPEYYEQQQQRVSSYSNKRLTVVDTDAAIAAMDS